ncbi:MAG: hypothetical protein JO253_03180 [Alphaproteobacteria bacterium]|nr:hypothetical protein [Alphaproteobacteria bacterium]
MDTTLTFRAKYSNPNESGPRYMLIGGRGIENQESATRYFERTWKNSDVQGVELLKMECLGYV